MYAVETNNSVRFYNRVPESFPGKVQKSVSLNHSKGYDPEEYDLWEDGSEQPKAPILAVSVADPNVYMIFKDHEELRSNQDFRDTGKDFGGVGDSLR